MADIGARTVYCGNLAWSVGWQDLKDLMRECGEVEHVEVLEYRDGRKTGSAIVRFKDVDMAAKAIDTMNDRDLKGRQIFVREDKEGGKGPGSKSKGKGKPLSDDQAARQVFVGNLSFKTTWKGLKDHMKSVGDVEYCDVLVGKDGRSNGNGLVRFATSKQAQIAIEELTDTDLDGRQIFVREDKEGVAIKGQSEQKGNKGKGKKGRRSQEYALHVANIPKDIDWKALKDGFKKYWPTHADVGEMRSGRNRGYGIVKFSSWKDADTALRNVQWIEEARVKVSWDDSYSSMSE